MAWWSLVLRLADQPSPVCSQQVSNLVGTWSNPRTLWCQVKVFAWCKLHGRMVVIAVGLTCLETQEKISIVRVVATSQYSRHFQVGKKTEICAERDCAPQKAQVVHKQTRLGEHVHHKWASINHHERALIDWSFLTAAEWSSTLDVSAPHPMICCWAKWRCFLCPASWLSNVPLTSPKHRLPSAKLFRCFIYSFFLFNFTYRLDAVDYM